MSLIENIRRRQTLRMHPPRSAPPAHRPEMLYIGCPDARLDPVGDIGIEQGHALIFRNIGAFVLRDNASLGAAIEYFIHYLPMGPEGVKHIVVAGHTDCGGIKACQQGCHNPHDHYLPLYLRSLEPLRSQIMEKAKAHHWSDAQVLHALERESIRHSLRNLLTYEPVKQAVNEGKVQLHGWLIDTETKSLSEMDPKTLEFRPMAD